MMRLVATLLLALWLASLATPAYPAGWDLSELYASPQAWQAGLEAAREQVRRLDRYQGTLGSSAAALREALAAASDARREVARLAAYARLDADADARVAAAQQRRAQAQGLEASLAEHSAWIAPELIALDPARLRAFVAEDAELARRFGFQIDTTLRRAPHTLGREGEAVLAADRVLLEQPYNVFQQLVQTELPAPRLRLGGRPVRLDLLGYVHERNSPVRADRRRAMEGYFGSLRAFEGSIGATLQAQVLGQVARARARRYGSALEAALFEFDVPVEVYRRVLDEARAALPTLHRYLRLRARRLGLHELAYHDNYPPLVPTPPGLHWDLAQSKQVTLEALAPLGDEYLALLRRGFGANWMNAAPAPGKNPGGYMNGAAYDVHPYLLLNHVDDYDSLTVFAHEWGHAVHTLLANASQPFETSDYSGFVAETASVANEMLLNDHLVAQARTRAEKLYYLSQGLEQIRTTYFRQALFGEFELAIFEEVEQGRALSGARLSELYCGLLRRYYGADAGLMRIGPAHCIEWAYLPHFYDSFYVYQYATSIVGAAGLTEAIRSEGAPARERFLAMLKAGASDSPYRIYRRAGIELAQAAPYRALEARMNRLIDAFEALERPR